MIAESDVVCQREAIHTRQRQAREKQRLYSGLVRANFYTQSAKMIHLSARLIRAKGRAWTALQNWDCLLLRPLR